MIIYSLADIPFPAVKFEVHSPPTMRGKIATLFRPHALALGPLTTLMAIFWTARGHKQEEAKRREGSPYFFVVLIFYVRKCKSSIEDQKWSQINESEVILEAIYYIMQSWYLDEIRIYDIHFEKKEKLFENRLKMFKSTSKGWKK